MPVTKTQAFIKYILNALCSKCPHLSDFLGSWKTDLKEPFKVIFTDSLNELYIVYNYI